MNKKKTFIKNTIILTITALLLRGIGMFFRVYLAGIIGAEGIGLYQMIFSAYMLTATFATSGISTAVTRLCADEMVCGSKKSVMRVLRRAVQISAFAGVVIGAAVFAGQDLIAEVFIGDARAARSLMILSFSLLPMGISACFKGYFMARRKALGPSSASVIEQIVRVAVVMILISQFAEQGIEIVCFFVLLSDTIAETISCGFMYLSFKKDSKKLVTTPVASASPRRGRVTAKLLKIAMPITAGKYLTSFLYTIENLIVPRSLAAFSGSKRGGIETFGLLKGMAMPIIFFPSSFLHAVSSLLIPEISQSVAVSDARAIRKDVERTLSVTIIGAIMVGGWFYLGSNSIGMALYNSREVGVLLNVLAPLIPVMYLESVVDGILKGLDKQSSTLFYSTIDSGMRILLIWLFVPRFGMDSFILIMVISNMLTCSLNLVKLLRVTVIKFDVVNWLAKPLIAIVAAVTAANFFTDGISSNILHIIFSVLIISVVYLGIILATKAVDFRQMIFSK